MRLVSLCTGSLVGERAKKTKGENERRDGKGGGEERGGEGRGRVKGESFAAPSSSPVSARQARFAR